MTLEDIGELLTYVHADSGTVFPAEKVRVWHDMFGAYDRETAFKAALQMLGEKQFGPPRACDFQAALDYVNTPPDEPATPELALALAMKFIQEVAAADAEKNHHKLPPLVWETMKMVGARKMREHSRPEEIHGQFCACYKALCHNRKLARRKKVPETEGRFGRPKPPVGDGRTTNGPISQLPRKA